MKVTVKFLFEADFLSIKFNGTQVESKWLESMVDALSTFMKSYFNVPVCNVKYRGRFTGFDFGGGVYILYN